jgi:hypothetical protein
MALVGKYLKKCCSCNCVNNDFKFVPKCAVRISRWNIRKSEMMILKLNELTRSNPDFSRQHHICTFSRVWFWWENIWRKVVRNNGLNRGQISKSEMMTFNLIESTHSNRFSRPHYLHTFSQKRKNGWEDIWRKVAWTMFLQICSKTCQVLGDDKKCNDNTRGDRVLGENHASSHQLFNYQFVLMWIPCVL